MSKHERHITNSITKRTASQNVKCTIRNTYTTFCNGIGFVTLYVLKLYVLELLPCVQLRFVTLRYVTFTLCCFTLCSNIGSSSLISQFSNWRVSSQEGSIGSRHREFRVLSLFSNRWNWDSPTPLHAGEFVTVAPMWGIYLHLKNSGTEHVIFYIKKLCLPMTHFLSIFDFLRI